MKSKTSIISILILMLFCRFCLADVELSGKEKEQLFKTLTNNFKSTWIQAGTIEAVQEEYRAPKTTDEKAILSEISKKIKEYVSNDNKAEVAEYLQKMALDAIPFNIRYRMSNEYTMKTTKVLKYDGKRYYYDIKVDSRVDSVKVPDELKSNHKTDQFNLTWNGRRILCDNGEKNTMYTPAVNHAFVGSSENFQNDSISLLTKGIIPWGYGTCTYDKLIKIESSAVAKTVDGHSEIHLSLINTDGSESIFVLDPEKAYAPISWVTNKADSTTINLYSDYKFVSDSWVPTSIVMEKFDKTHKLLEGDYITITKISGEVPSTSSFVVDFIPNTLIEYRYDNTKPDLQYFYSNTANSDLLLAERMAYMEAEGKQLQNCATSTLQYAALKLGNDILSSQLSELVNPDDSTTSMKDMKKYAESKGLYCKAVTTDIQTLKELSGCQVILHLPDKNHYVLLDRIDQNYIWLIDLTKDNFYYRANASLYNMEWTEGTALLVSNQPITLPSGATEIPDAYLIGYTGGLGYSCTYLMQKTLIIPCLYNETNCYGIYELMLQRIGCELAESGICLEDFRIEKFTWPCINYPAEPYMCKWDVDNRVIYYTLSCQ